MTKVQLSKRNEGKGEGRERTFGRERLSTPFLSAREEARRLEFAVSTLFLTCGPSACLDKKQKCHAYRLWLSIMVLGTLLRRKRDFEERLDWKARFGLFRALYLDMAREECSIDYSSGGSKERW